MTKTLVLGLGNLVHSDDGLGVHAIQSLSQDQRAPSEVALMDGGAQGLSLLPHISPFQRLLVIDALDAGEPPGTLMRLEGEALKNLPGKASVHQLGFADLMVALELLGESPEEIVLLGVQPLSTEWSAELTPPVREALAPLLDAVIQQLEVWSNKPECVKSRTLTNNSVSAPAAICPHVREQIGISAAVASVGRPRTKRS